MSTKGTFVFTSVGPTVYVPVSVEFGLPPLAKGKTPLRVVVKARVRLERDPADPVHSGFAVSYENAVLREGEENQPE